MSIKTIHLSVKLSSFWSEKKILTGEKIFENVYEKRKIACVKMILHPLKYKNSAKDGFHVHFSFSCGKNTGHT